jgi:hypothetical protein
VVQAVDAAEAKGHVHQALALIKADVEHRRDTKTFWHPERRCRLLQIAVLGSLLPGWAVSRWILAQAVRWMDASQRHRFTQAFDRTVQVAGGPERYPGVDALDSSCKLVDYDWVYRQLVLYELGGLQHFLDRVASRALVDRADGIQDWAGAPMGAYRLTAQTSNTLRWLDLSSGSEPETANIGSASLLEIGEHALGRMVVTKRGPMFESAPIFVPPDVATRVGEAPYDWMSALERGCHRKAEIGLRISTRAPGFPMLSDVPDALRCALIDTVVGPSSAEVLTWSAADVHDAHLAVIRAAAQEQVDFADLGLDPWPVVGSMLLDPATVRDLVLRPRVQDAAAFDRLAARLASPADEVCRMLALACRTAA